MKSVFALGAIAAAALLGAASSAHAVATLQFSVDNGTTWTTVTDNGVGDLDPQAHVVLFSGTLGGFTLNVTTGQGNLYTPVNLMDLNSFQANTAGPGSLIVKFSDTGFSEVGNINGLWGGVVSLNGNLSVTAAAYAGTSNALFEQSVLLGSMGPQTSGGFNASFNQMSPMAGTYSLTQIVTITATGAGNYSGNFELVLPEPGTLALAGAALLALGALRRRT